MTDTLNEQQQHYNMSRIRSKDTKPEEIVRKYLFSKGLRFRKNDRRYPGHPDVVLPKYKTVVFVNGCFWHRHEGCRYASTPATNRELVRKKRRARRTGTEGAAGDGLEGHCGVGVQTEEGRQGRDA